MRPCILLWAAQAQATDYSVLAFVALLVLAGGAALTWYWLKREEREEPASDADLLAEFEQARDAGEMDEEEFRRVSASLRKRMGLPASRSPKPGQRPKAEFLNPAADTSDPQSPPAESAAP
jgi:hypothetical protein